MATTENSNCPVCRKICLDTQNCICCDNCENWFHLRCSKLTRKDFKFFQNPTSIYTLAIIAPTTSVENVLNLFLTTTMPCCDNTCCNTWFHLKCTNISLHTYSTMHYNKNTEQWFCNN